MSDQGVVPRLHGAEEGAEGGFFFEFGADAVAGLGDDEFAFGGLSGDDAEFGFFVVREVYVTEEVCERRFSTSKSVTSRSGIFHSRPQAFAAILTCSAFLFATRS